MVTDQEHVHVRERGQAGLLGLEFLSVCWVSG